MIARTFFGSVLLFCVTMSTHGNVMAELIVSVEDAEISAGETGFVDVLIRSTSDVNVNLANYGFVISTIGDSSSALNFLSPQIGTEDVLDSEYLFFNDNVALVSLVDSAGLLIEGNDLTASGLGVTLGTSERLLVRLDVEHILQLGQTSTDAIGDQFSIALTPDPGVTFFEDSSSINVPIDDVSFSLSNAGIVTVSSIPEPSSLMVLGYFAVWGLSRRRCRC